MTDDQLTTLVAQLDRNTAIALIYDIFARFGWQGAFFSREDIITELTSNGEDTTLTAEQVEVLADQVENSYEWVNMPDSMITAGWECIYSAIDELRAQA